MILQISKTVNNICVYANNLEVIYFLVLKQQCSYHIAWIALLSNIWDSHKSLGTKSVNNYQFLSSNIDIYSECNLPIILKAYLHSIVINNSKNYLYSSVQKPLSICPCLILYLLFQQMQMSENEQVFLLRESLVSYSIYLNWL